MDDAQRIAMIETETIDTNNDPSPTELIRYQFSNHLGSASLELDDNGTVISYEEYYPYGSTSYQAVDKNIKAAAKRYRYTGKERDEETGLYCHGARYYACWLGRWSSADPIGVRGGLNVYEYAKGSPILHRDLSGEAPTDPQRLVTEAARLELAATKLNKEMKLHSKFLKDKRRQIGDLSKRGVGRKKAEMRRLQVVIEETKDRIWELDELKEKLKETGTELVSKLKKALKSVPPDTYRNSIQSLLQNAQEQASDALSKITWAHGGGTPSGGDKPPTGGGGKGPGGTGHGGGSGPSSGSGGGPTTRALKEGAEEVVKKGTKEVVEEGVGAMLKKGAKWIGKKLPFIGALVTLATAENAFAAETLAEAALGEASVPGTCGVLDLWLVGEIYVEMSRAEAEIATERRLMGDPLTPAERILMKSKH